jgi:hypothetical protein
MGGTSLPYSNTVLFRLAPFGGSWLCSESSRSTYVAIVYKYYLFFSLNHCIHKLLDIRNKAAKKQRACKAKKHTYSRHAKKRAQSASNSCRLSEEAGQ